MLFSQIRSEVLRLEEKGEGHVTLEQRSASRKLLESYSSKAIQLAEKKDVPDVDALVEIDDAEGRKLIMQVREIYGAALKGEADAIAPQKSGFQPDPRLE